MTSGLRTPRRGIGAGRSALAAARAFYCDALGGRQMRRLQLADGSSMFRFLVGDELVLTGPGIVKDRVTLVVDDALAIAERCWDAGFEVRVHGAADATSVVVIDPFDRELEVVAITSRSSVE
jgi:hypothetical protein